MKRVLYVGGPAEMRATLHKLLGPHCRLETVVTQRDALAALERDPADVVISAWQLPDGEGPALLATVEQRWPETVRAAVIDDDRWVDARPGVAQSLVPRHPGAKQLIKQFGLDRRRNAAAAGEIEVVADAMELEPTRPIELKRGPSTKADGGDAAGP